MSPAEMEAQIREIFVDADKDQNGYLDRNEFKSVGSSHMPFDSRMARLQPPSISAPCSGCQCFLREAGHQRDGRPALNG